MSVIKIEEARALPLIERTDSRLDERARVRPLCQRRVDGAIALFLDTDGRPMKVVERGKTLAKVPFDMFSGWAE